MAYVHVDPPKKRLPGCVQTGFTLSDPRENCTVLLISGQLLSGKSPTSLQLGLKRPFCTLQTIEFQHFITGLINLQHLHHLLLLIKLWGLDPNRNKVGTFEGFLAGLYPHELKSSFFALYQCVAAVASLATSRLLPAALFLSWPAWCQSDTPPSLHTPPTPR